MLALAGCSPLELDEELASLERPNPVLIVVDTLRADWTSAYGHDEDTTPEIARWTARGVFFERVRSQSSWTKISMASSMTSLWRRTLAIEEARDGLAERAVTLAGALLGRYRRGEVRAEARNTDIRIDPSIADRLRAMGDLQ